MISVVIVNFNGGPLLADCVRSVLASTSPVEVLVSDNGSVDNSLALLRERFGDDRRLRVVENGKNLGFAKANNVVLPMALGGYVLFLNPDCLVQPDTLGRMAAAMEARPDVGMAGCLLRNVDGSEQAGARRSVPTPWRAFVRASGLSRLFPNGHPMFKDFLLKRDDLPDKPTEMEAISGAFMFVRRAAMEAVGPLDDGYFMHCEDLDWCMRFRQGGWKILFVPDVEAVHIKGTCSSTYPIRVELYKHRGMIRFYKKFFRYQYPGLLMWLVIAAVWARFAAKVVVLSAWPAAMPPPHVVPEEENIPLEPEKLTGSRPDGAPIVVTGATSQIGTFLLPRLTSSGFHVHALSRGLAVGSRGAHRSVTWHAADLSRNTEPPDLSCEVLIHAAPLWLLPDMLEPLSRRGLRHVIAFGSTSRFTKASSKNMKEQALANRLLETEKVLADQCERLGIAWTLFRPTMIYGCGRDRNITTIARFIGNFGFFPLLGEGLGLRQPVHAEDLAVACIAALNQPSTHNRAYNLSGGETLSYRKMVEAVFLGLGKKPHLVGIPLPLFKGGIALLSLLPRYRHLSGEMASRMNENLCFDHAEATRDFGYRPRKFEYRGEVPTGGPGRASELS